MQIIKVEVEIEMIKAIIDLCFHSLIGLNSIPNIKDAFLDLYSILCTRIDRYTSVTVIYNI